MSKIHEHFDIYRFKTILCRFGINSCENRHDWWLYWLVDFIMKEWFQTSDSSFDCAVYISITGLTCAACMMSFPLLSYIVMVICRSHCTDWLLHQIKWSRKHCTSHISLIIEADIDICNPIQLGEFGLLLSGLYLLNYLFAEV